MGTLSGAPHAAPGLWSIAVGLLTICSAHAQSLPSGAAAGPAFEVVSIKPTKPDNLARSIRPYPGGRVIAQGATLKFLIQWAYQVQDFQISKATGWMNSDRYDIEAKAVGGLNLNNKQSGAMFQA
ncbi:MAG: TIGR03435 family protein, partial [Acidobacteriota bacterium]